MEAHDLRAHALDNRIPPPVLVLVLGLVMTGAAVSTPTLDALALRVIGSGLILVGLGLVVAGFRTFRGAGTTIDPVKVDAAKVLVTHGLFGRSRNPMYVGFTTALVGWAAALGSPVALVGPAVFATFVTRFQIEPEERVLRHKFGETYERYRAAVPRWL